MNESATAWWQRAATSAPSGLGGLWFGLVELDAGWHLYVAGTARFDPDDETAEWAVGPYVWWPDDRYLPLPAIADLSVDTAIEYAADVVRALAPWTVVDVEGVATGFDDGDFAIVHAP